MIKTLEHLFERDLNHLANELNAYQNEANLWLTPGEVNNSAGNLCIHLCGNLQHFMGATLGNTGYIRNRPYEFEAKDVPRTEILKEIEITKKVVLSTLGSLSAADLEKEFPIKVFKSFEGEMSTQLFLTHLHGHLTYHVGQISYHRRILDN